MQAHIDFRETLDEVYWLLEQIRMSHESDISFDALSKAIIVLIAAKFESYLESCLEEYCYSIQSFGLRMGDVPEAIRGSMVRHMLSEETIRRACKFDKKIYGHIASATKAFDDEEIAHEIKIDCTFNYGRHGEKEIRKLFNRIGIEEIFQRCKIMVPVEGDDEMLEEITAQATVNAVTAFRNKISHGDGSISVTELQISNYLRNLSAFAQAVDEHLEVMLAEVSSLRPALL